MLEYLTGLDITDGSSVRMDCPECKGRNTFTVSNVSGQLLWNCYKAGCSISGANKVGMSANAIHDRLNRIVSVKANDFELPMYIVPVPDASPAHKWVRQWGLDITKNNLKYDVREHRIVFPVVHKGITVDATGRALGKRLPKWKRYGNCRLPYVHGCGKVAVVVEDCISAAVVGEDRYTGVALMGTSMSNEQKQYLAQFSTAIVALDPDALQKTLTIAKELRSAVDNVKVLRIQDDLKYRNTKDMDALNKL
jgi:hypothetical protein